MVDSLSSTSEKTINCDEDAQSLCAWVETSREDKHYLSAPSSVDVGLVCVEVWEKGAKAVNNAPEECTTLGCTSNMQWRHGERTSIGPLLLLALFRFSHDNTAFGGKPRRNRVAPI